jgi:hypothetical protein
MKSNELTDSSNATPATLFISWDPPFSKQATARCSALLGKSYKEETIFTVVEAWRRLVNMVSNQL